MEYAFTAYGHPNILATHKTTLEITKDSELTKRGNCIIAVAADFSLQKIKELVRSCGSNDKIRLTIAVAEIKEEIIAVANREFGSEHEIVLRKGNFVSERTLGIKADEAASDLGKELVDRRLKSGKTAVSIRLETL